MIKKGLAMSLNIGDLRDSIENKIHIDEYSSKMGDDKDIIVFSFLVKYKNQAEDLVNFLEKGYEWVLDADVSPGEMEDGSHLVFVETKRRPSFPSKFLSMLDDMKGITQIKQYEFAYRDSNRYLPVTLENLENTVPVTPRAYKRKKSAALEDMQMAAGLEPRIDIEMDRELKDFVNLSRR